MEIVIKIFIAAYFINAFAWLIFEISNIRSLLFYKATGDEWGKYNLIFKRCHPGNWFRYIKKRKEFFETLKHGKKES